MVRSGKFWRDREKRIMGGLGLRTQPGSGSLDWTRKEDGESDTILAQLKSTEAKSITVNKQDLLDLFYHARVSHKLPVFVIDFVGQESFQMLLVRRDELKEIAEALHEDQGSSEL